MSVLYRDDDCYLVDHGNYIQNLYTNLELYNEQKSTFSFLPKLFLIRSKTQLNRKRSHNYDELQDEASELRNLYETFKNKISQQIQKDVYEKCSFSETEDIRTFAQLLFESTNFDHDGINGGNNADIPVACTVKNQRFLIPPRCRFYCGDVLKLCEKLEGCKFDIVIADPPWWNKYIRRLKNANDKLGYKMMYNEDIASIPIKNHLAENCLVAVWCTNAPSHIAAVKDLIFPKWGVEYLTTWYWLKVNIELQPICDFGSGSRKQPYERIMLGKVGDVKVPERKLIVSVPSALHSHKPPLIDLLKPYLSTENPQTLELFARYLLPDTTSIGYEPLKWQHESLYEMVS